MTHLILCDYEGVLVDAAGRARRACAIDGSRPGRYGYDDVDPLTTDINAAGGELAAAIVYGLPWTGCFHRHLSPKPADIGRGTEVKTVSRMSDRLILHREDRDDWYAVLVVGSLPEYWVIGSIRIREAKQERWWVDPTGKGRHAYFLPQTEVRPAPKLRSRAHP